MARSTRSSELRLAQAWTAQQTKEMARGYPGYERLREGELTSNLHTSPLDVLRPGEWAHMYITQYDKRSDFGINIMRSSSLKFGPEGLEIEWEVPTDSMAPVVILSVRSPRTLHIGSVDRLYKDTSLYSSRDMFSPPAEEASACL